MKSIWIGFEPRETAAFAVCRASINLHLTQPVPVNGIVLDDMRELGLYRRQTGTANGQLWDVISEAPMSTEFAISRFLTPILAQHQLGGGMAMFMDCDIMARANLIPLLDACAADKTKAVWCVKHNHQPTNDTKMDGQAQTRYSRKNWSSVMVFNCDHPSNTHLTIDLVNSVPGRDLHRFCWLEDSEIGELHPVCNYLVGHTKLEQGVEPELVHWTDGAPCMPGYEDAEYADEFNRMLRSWAR